MIELYAIAEDSGRRLPDTAGLSAVGHDGLSAIFAPASSEPVSPERLWHYEEVVEKLMRDRDVLPVRYGTRLEDPAAAARVLERRHDELAAALDAVRGAVELSVRVMTTEAESPVSGAEYLAAQSEPRALHERLVAACRASRRRPAASTREVLRAAYLVERDQVDRFIALIAELESERPALRLLCTGPWPPYSFVQQ